MCDSTRCFQHNSDPCDFAVYFTCLSHLKKEVFNRHTQGQDQMALGIFSQGIGILKKWHFNFWGFYQFKIKIWSWKWNLHCKLITPRGLQCKGLFTWSWGTRPQVGIGEVTCGGLPHLTCKRDDIKMRDFMDRRVIPPKRVTSPTWGPPPPCKQALIQWNPSLWTYYYVFHCWSTAKF